MKFNHTSHRDALWFWSSEYSEGGGLTLLGGQGFGEVGVEALAVGIAVSGAGEAAGVGEVEEGSQAVEG